MIKWAFHWTFKIIPFTFTNINCWITFLIVLYFLSLHKEWENYGVLHLSWRKSFELILTLDWNSSTDLRGKCFPLVLYMTGDIIEVSGVWLSVAANQSGSALSNLFLLYQWNRIPRLLCKLDFKGFFKTFFLKINYSLIVPLPSHFLLCLILAESGSIITKRHVILSIWMCKSWDKSNT